MIILFGLAGSGKGTQGKALAELFGWSWISVGEVIRRTKKYDSLINRGELIPDRDVIHMMHDEIAASLSQGKDVVLDGYPRDEIQAEYVVRHYAKNINAAIVLEVPKSELYQRLAIRGRDDDRERESIDQRFKVFEQNIYPILSLLKKHNIPIHKVNGVGSVEDVTKRLVKIVGESLDHQNSENNNLDRRKP